MSLVFALAFAFVAALVGTAAGFALSRRSVADVRTAGRLEADAGWAPKLSAAETRLQATEAELGRARSQAEQLAAEQRALAAAVAERDRSLASLEAQLAAERTAAAQRLADEGAMADRFNSLARRALSENSSSFLETARENFKAEQEAARGKLEAKHEAFLNTLEPIEEQMQQLGKRVEQLSTDKERLADEARSLSSALRKAEVRGRWGELQLQRVAELAGMSHRCDFTLQQSFANDEDKQRRPDMVVHLPLGRYVVVDSKAVMDAYVSACSSDDPAQYAACIAQHAKNVRTKIDDLARVDYARVLQKQDKNVADMVVCFIPGEDFFSAALAADPLLLEYAAQKNVFLASPTTLITLLRAIALGWRDHELSENAEQVRKLGRELYARLTTMKSYFDSLGTSLTATVGHYNRMVGSLNSRVFPQARKFQTLGAVDKNASDLPDTKAVENLVADHTSADWTAGVLAFAASAGEDDIPVEN